MATVAALMTDLQNLISESKRRNSEIKHAAEVSLSFLKKFDPNKGSEPEFIKDMALEPNFITPFLLSCQSRNIKFSSIAVYSLYRIIAVRGIPLGSLRDVLDSLLEASHLPIEIQLKVLQLLPTVYQSFGSEMNGPLISKLLLICAVLQGANKPPVVINTAAATFQQLVIFIFEKIVDEKIDESEKSATVKIDKDQEVHVSDNVYDCFRIFSDLCSLIEHQKPIFLQFDYLTETFLFELIESILTNFTQVFIHHKELGYLLRFRLTPILLRCMSVPSKEFSVVVRVARIILLLIRKNLSILEIECEIVISLLNHMILNETQSAIWKKMVVLEIFQGVFQDVEVIEQIFSLYDSNKDRKHVINDFFINSLCIINSAHSKKSLKTKSVIQPAPSENLDNPQENTFMVDTNPKNFAYLEMLDKTEPPAAPNNYLYSLILKCASTFVETFGDHVTKSDFFRVLKSYKFFNSKNVEDVESEEQKNQIVLYRAVVLQNYQVLLSLFETYLYSVLSNECFYDLLSTLYTLCYSSGVLGLPEPRDRIANLLAVSCINNTEVRHGHISRNSGQFNRDQTSAATTEKKEQQSAPATKSFGESFFGSISSRFSTHANTVANAVASATSSAENITGLANSPTSPYLGATNAGHIVLHSRYLNDRHLGALRVLHHLIVSLGPYVRLNWKDIFIALQWMDYYIRGPPESFEKPFVYMKTSLGNSPVARPNEIAASESAIKNYPVYFKKYSLKSLMEVLSTLISLSDTVIFCEVDKTDKLYYELNAVSVFKSTEIKDGDPQELCPCFYNKQFYLDSLSKIVDVSASRFLAELLDPSKNITDLLAINDECTTSCKVVFNYLFQLCSNRDLSSYYRILSCSIFNKGLAEIAKENTKVNKDSGRNSVEQKLLQTLKHLLLKFEISEEAISPDNEQSISISVVNCEFDMIVKCLENLKDILDMYGLNFDQSAWSMIFEIIDLSFNLFEFSQPEVSSYGFSEKKLVITKLSFEILQLILNDFLGVLSLPIVKHLINTTHSFTSQTSDINVSFTSISYFWQISDHIRSSLLTSVSKESQKLGSKKMLTEIKNADDLSKYIQNLETIDTADEQAKFIAYNALWIHLLEVLVETSSSERDQVRNGAIQTFFRILETHGKDLSSSWDLCYNIVISKLLASRPLIPRGVSLEQLAQFRTEWSESLTLITNGAVKFYQLYFVDFTNEHVLVYWNGLFKFFEDVLELNWNDCDLKLYEAFNELLDSFANMPNVPTEISELLFKFWSFKGVSYNVTLNKHYQESLTLLMKSFVSLVKVTDVMENEAKAQKTLQLLNFAIKYPILPTLFNDNVYPTDLQKSVLEDLKILAESKSIQIQSGVLLQLVAIVVLPFSTRNKIKEQLKSKLSKDIKICTFVSVSYHSVKILRKCVDSITDYKILVQNDCVNKLLSRLLEPIKQAAKGVKGSKELWKECFDIIVPMLEKLSPIMHDDESKNEISFETKEQFWQLVVEIFKTNLNLNVTEPEGEEFCTNICTRLKDIIVPSVALTSFRPQLLANLAKYVLDYSYIYEKDEIEEEFVNLGTVEGTLKKLSVVEPKTLLLHPVKMFSRHKLRLMCLNDLIELSKFPENEPSDEAQKLISSEFFPCFLVRLLYVLKKFEATGNIVNHAPIPKIQRVELLMALKGLNDLLDNFSRSQFKGKDSRFDQFGYVVPRLVKTIPIGSKVRGVSDLVENFMYEFASKSMSQRRTITG